MKCLICAKFCIGVMCKECLDLIPFSPSVREVSGVRVYCFFAYSDIDFLLKAKYYAIGSRIFGILGRLAGEYFFSQEAMKGVDFSEVKMIGIDDCVRSFYSHTGILVREFSRASAKSSLNSYTTRKKQHLITPIYGELKAKNQISYAGKSLAYRQANKRGLTFKTKSNNAKSFVIVDDIITTGTSFNEAIEVLQSNDAKVLFCLSLCNAAL